MTQAIYIENDNLLRVDRLRDAATGGYLNNLTTVTAHLRQRDGQDVGGQAWPITLGYVAGSSGRYHGTLADVLVLADGVKVFCTVDVDAGAGKKGRIVLELATTRREG